MTDIQPSASNARPATHSGKRTRNAGRKVRTGCRTCKIRRVKCDEQRPHCKRCLDGKWTCDGYEPNPPKRSNANVFINVVPRMNGPRTVAAPSRCLNRLSGSTHETRSLEYYFHHVGPHLSGDLDSDFWVKVVLRLGVNEPAIRHATMAISSLHQNAVKMASSKGLSLSLNDPFSLTQYNKAISSLVDRITTGSASPEVSLVSCILFTCLETYLGIEPEAALTHLKAGLNILAGLHIKRLSSRSETIQDAYTLSRITEDPCIDELEKTIWPVFARLNIVGFLFGQDLLPLYNSFQKLYYDIPTDFKDLSEARSLLIDISNMCMSFVRQMSVKKYLGRVTVDDRTRQSQLLLNLEKWLEAFNRLDTSPDLPQRAVKTMRILHTCGWIWISCVTSTAECSYDRYMPGFQKITTLAASILAEFQTPETSSFSFEMELVPPLFFTGCRCRDPTIRRQAIELLTKYPRREGIWQTDCRIVATFQMRLEEAGMRGCERNALPPEKVRLHNAVFADGFHQFVYDPDTTGPELLAWIEDVERSPPSYWRPCPTEVLEWRDGDLLPSEEPGDGGRSLSCSLAN